jgi:hypothetical protein
MPLDDLKKLAGKKHVAAGNDVLNLQLVFVGFDEYGSSEGEVRVNIPYNDFYALAQPSMQATFAKWGQACDELVRELLKLGQEAKGGPGNLLAEGDGCCGGSCGSGASCAGVGDGCASDGCGSSDAGCGRDGCVPPASGGNREP